MKKTVFKDWHYWVLSIIALIISPFIALYITGGKNDYSSDFEITFLLAFSAMFFYIQYRRCETLEIPAYFVALSLIPFLNIAWWIYLGFAGNKPWSLERQEKIRSIKNKILTGSADSMNSVKSVMQSDAPSEDSMSDVDVDALAGNKKYQLYLQTKVKNPKLTLVLTLLIGPLGYIYLSFKFAFLWFLAVSSLITVNFIVFSTDTAVDVLIGIWLINAIACVVYAPIATRNHNAMVKKEAYLLYGE